jgi:signal transduction histidine kinase
MAATTPAELPTPPSLTDDPHAVASERALRESEALRFIGQQLAGQVESGGLLYQLVRHARAMLEADLVAVAARPDAGGWQAAVGFESDRFRRDGYDASHALAARVMAERRPVVFDRETWPEDALLASEGVEVACGVPLVVAGEPVGALVAGYRRRTEVTNHQLSLAQVLASYASLRLDNARLIAQAEARATEADAERRLLRAVLENLPLGIVIASADGTVLDFNPAATELAGALRAGMPYADAVAAIDSRRADGTPLGDEGDPLTRALREGETVSGLELNARTADGGRRPLLANAAPVPGADGLTRAAVLSLQDVSPLKEVERLKDEFLSVVSHELRTPLTPLLGLTQLLLRSAERGRMPQPEQLAVTLRTIYRQALHMNELVDDLLDVSRIQQGRFDVVPEELDLIALAATVLERFQSLAAVGTSHCLLLTTVAPSITGMWDRRRLDQVLTNLVSNAVKYSPPGSDVILSVTVTGAHVRVGVRDQGIGIPAAEAHHLFEPFYRAGNAPVRNYPGVGLSLHITREIVNRHGGRILVESAEGQGSTFTVELPLVAPSPTARERGA